MKQIWKVTITKYLFWRTLLSPWPTVHSGPECNQSTPKFISPTSASFPHILNFTADSSGALKWFFCLLCSPYRHNNEMLTILWQICLKTAKTSPEKLLYFFKLRTVAAKFLWTDSLDSGENAHIWFSAGFGGIRNLFLAKVKKVKIYDIISSSFWYFCANIDLIN